METNTFWQAKINNLGIASLAYNTKVNSGLTFGIGGSFDTQKLNSAPASPLKVKRLDG
jgi:voltage-dependent anion channel protein 2